MQAAGKQSHSGARGARGQMHGGRAGRSQPQPQSQSQPQPQLPMHARGGVSLTDLVVFGAVVYAATGGAHAGAGGPAERAQSLAGPRHILDITLALLIEHMGGWRCFRGQEAGMDMSWGWGTGKCSPGGRPRHPRARSEARRPAAAGARTSKRGFGGRVATEKL